MGHESQCVDGWRNLISILVREGERPQLLALAQAAQCDNVLGRLFPYVSLDRLRFSDVPEYPFSLHYPFARAVGDSYRVWTAEGRPIGDFALPDAIKELSARCSSLSSERKSE